MPADSAAPPWAPAAERGADAPDYETLYAALAATAEGRWFLEQHADRSRQAVTAQVLTAIDRLKDEVAGVQPEARPAAEPRGLGPGLERLRDGLDGLAAALTAVQAELGTAVPGVTTERQSILAATDALQEIARFTRERGIDSWMGNRLDGLSEEIRAVCAVPDLTAQRTRVIAGALAEVGTRLDALREDVEEGVEDSLFAELPAPAANANLPAEATLATETWETERPEGGAAEAVEIAAHPLPPAVEELVAEIAALALASRGLIVVETAETRPAAAENDADPIMPSPAAETAAVEAEAEPPVEPASAVSGAVAFERPDVSSQPAEAMFAEAERPPRIEMELPVNTEPDEAAAADWEPPQPPGDPEQPQASPRLSHLLMVAELDRLLAAQAASETHASPEPVDAPPSGVEAISVDTTDTDTAATDAAAAAIDRGPAETAPIETVQAPPLVALPVDDEPVEISPDTLFADASESLPPTAVGAAASELREPLPSPSVPAARPSPNETSKLAKVDLAAFADVMALSDEERIALFT